MSVEWVTQTAHTPPPESDRNKAIEECAKEVERYAADFDLMNEGDTAFIVRALANQLRKKKRGGG